MGSASQSGALRRSPVAVRGLVALAVGLCAYAFYGPELHSPRVHADESAYLCAAERMHAGDNPYGCDRYLYPPVLAQLGALWLQVGGVTSLKALLRALGLAGGVWLALRVVRALPLPELARAALAVALLALGPPFRAALVYGNVSLWVAALAGWALDCWPRRPLTAGLALGVAVAVKPLACLALPLLWLHRSDGCSRQARLSALIGAAVVGLLVLPDVRLVPDMLAQAYAHPRAFRNTSLVHLFAELGLAPHPLWIVAGVLAGALALCRRRALAPEELARLACVASLLAAPTVWNHSFALVLPMLGDVLARALTSQPLASPSGSSRSAAAWLVSSAALCVLSSNGFGDLGGLLELPGPVRALLLAIPLCAPSGVLAYAWGGRRALGDRASPPQ